MNNNCRLRILDCAIRKEKKKNILPYTICSLCYALIEEEV